MTNTAWVTIHSSKSNKTTPTATPPPPPGPRGIPLFGNLLSLEPELHSYFAGLAHIYGPIFKLRLGNKVGIVMSSPSMARQVLKDQDVTFANRDITEAGRAATYGGSDIAWSSYGPEWRMLRKVCALKLLSNITLDSFYMLRRKHVRETAGYLYSRVGSPVNVGEQMFLTMLNLITNMLWGGTVEEDGARLGADFREVVLGMTELLGKPNISDFYPVEEDGARLGADFREVVLGMTELLGKPNISDFYPGLARFDLQGIRKKMDGLARRFDRIFDVMIDQRLKIDQEGGSRESGSKDFLQFLLKLKDEGDSNTPLTMIHLKALLMDMVVGGTDTSSHTIEFAMAEIMNKPEGEKLDLIEKFGIVLKKKTALVAIPTPRLTDPSMYE
nr:costunolide synthase [Quercus suber]